MKHEMTRRLAALEQARYDRMTPLERAYELVARKVAVEQWPDAELDAFVAERPEFDTLTDEALDLLIARAMDRGRARHYAAAGGVACGGGCAGRGVSWMKHTSNRGKWEGWCVVVRSAYNAVLVMEWYGVGV